MYTNRSKGFTLIELLVVIAIIGILSAVVLASLNTARSKGNDASIQSNLTTIRTQAEVEYTSAAGYATACSNSNAAKALVSINAIVGSAGTCTQTATQFAASAKLSGGTRWCVDSSGFSGTGTDTAGKCN